MRCLIFFFSIASLCLSLALAIGQGEHDDTTVVRQTHPNAHASTHEAPIDPNHYAGGQANFPHRTPIYDKESAKLYRLQEEASMYREALKGGVGSDGTVLLKAPAQQVEAKLSKIERKLIEKEGKVKIKGSFHSYKQADPEVRAQFDEYYRQTLENNHQSACLAFYDLKNQEKMQGFLSLADRTKMKIDQVRCKVEKSDLFQKFVGGSNPAGNPNGNGGFHGNAGAAGAAVGSHVAPDAERDEPVQRITRHVITKTTRHLIKKP